MRTPLSKVRGLGSAKDGTEHYRLMGLTSLANVPLTLFFIWQVVSLYGQSYEMVVERLSQPLVAVVMALVMVSAIFHMKLGMQTIIEDYIHGENRKLMLLIANTFFSVFVGALSLFAVLKLGLAG
ncbi:MAG: succinate dehydrogenase, hydrophobic membrane anchor protein [Rhizobiaceae bacterium]|nr:succinate dehydrogenase, hydrophobic membrane anchor protein [Rhizobiaceae bacterium]